MKLWQIGQLELGRPEPYLKELMAGSHPVYLSINTFAVAGYLCVRVFSHKNCELEVTLRFNGKFFTKTIVQESELSVGLINLGMTLQRAALLPNISIGYDIKVLRIIEDFRTFTTIWTILTSLFRSFLFHITKSFFYFRHKYVPERRWHTDHIKY